MTNMDTIVETIQGKIKIVRFCKEHRKNAIDLDMMVRVTNILNAAAIDDKILVVVLTGTGNIYSSGLDLGGTIDTENAFTIFHNFMTTLIKFPKLLIAVVNGPAMGLAASTMPLCDFVFAEEKAYFSTPFTELGVVAEGCSSYTFPRLMGERKAAEMLLINHKMPAKEALEYGFINYIYKKDEEIKVWDKIKEISNSSEISIMTSKNLLRRLNEEILMKANDNEIKELSSIMTGVPRSKI